MKSKVVVGILVFADAEELDFVGPLEVFGMAAEFSRQCRILVISEALDPVRCAHGMRVVPECDIESAPDLDLLIVPGGRGARLHARNNPKILQLIKQQQGIVASVCTGAIVLASAGVLDGVDATTHYAHSDQLREFDRVNVREGVRFVMHDRVATSAGVTAGIDLSLAFVARFFDEPLADRIAKNLEWDSTHWKKR